MAAITTLLLAHLKPGDHAIFQNDLYGGTIQFINLDLVEDFQQALTEAAVS